jgi:hypothetical protein
MTDVAVELHVALSGEELDVRAVVTNEGEETGDSGIRRSRLLVDGEPSQAWSFAISNGAGDVRERELPPGEQVEARRVLKVRALGGAGEHELVLEVGGARSEPVTVTVP